MGTVDYDQIEWLAGQVAFARDVLDGARTSHLGAALATTDVGDTEGATDCRWQHEHLAHNAGLALENLVSVLTSDVDRLRLAVDTYRESDRASANRVLSAGDGTLDVFTTHAHSGGSEEDDRIRARQLGTFIDAVEEGSDGPTIVSMDANVSIHEDEQRGNDDQAPEELGRFDDMGYMDAADVGPTYHDRSIDYVFTSPGLEPGDADRIEADSDNLSDHDGQAVDISLNRW